MQNLRYCFIRHSKAPYLHIAGYMLTGFVAWIGVTTTPPKARPKFITNPQTAEDFARRCKVNSEKQAYQLALKDCNKSISLSPSSPDGYFNRSHVRHKLGDEQLGVADYLHGRKLMMERDSKQAELIRKSTKF